MAISLFLSFIFILAIGFFGVCYLVLPRFKGSEVIPSFVNYGNAKLVTAGGFALLAVMAFINFLAFWRHFLTLFGICTRALNLKGM